MKFISLLTILAISMVLNLEVNAQAPLYSDGGYRGGSIKGIKKNSKALNFLVFGDWGRNGDNYQREVAAGMGKAAHDIDASFVVVTGDNFYPYGVKSTQDYQWISSFESIYTAQSLHVRWYPVLGNHDYLTNPDAQIAYSDISARWNMPGRYYSKKFNVGGDTSQSVLIVFIDTDPFEKKMRGTKNDSTKYPAGGVEVQQAWLEKTLGESNAKWKLVVGHHPLYSGGWRTDSKDTKNMRDFLEPIFAKYKVDIYICGHEHHQEYVKPEGFTHYIISGAGSESRATSIKHPVGEKFISSEQGFATFSIFGNQTTVQFINYKHEIIYEAIIKK